MAKSTQNNGKNGLGRRNFLKGAAAGAAGATALVTGVDAPKAQAQAPRGGAGIPAPTEQQVNRDAGNARPPAQVERTVKVAGSDLMVQVLKDLGIEYVASNPGSSFEGLQESIVNYGNPPNTMPEFITALHEDSAVDMANGYGKSEGKPMCALLHGTIGIQHACMAIYQAFYAGTPVVLLAGRDDTFIQAHTADDMAGFVRSITKWDAQPKTLEESLKAIQEAYRQAITPPTGPTLVVLDTEIQKAEGVGVAIPRYTPPTISGIDTSMAREIAAALLKADNPRINVGNLRTPEGVQLAVDLAELVGASCSTRATGGPMSFPQRHPLCGPGASTEYDYSLGLESPATNVSLTGPAIRSIAKSRDQIGIGWGGLRENNPAGGGFGGGGGRGGRGGRGGGQPNATPTEVDAQASIPAIIAEVTRQMTPAQKRTIEQRSARHTVANQQAFVDALSRAMDDKRIGWDATPISTARVYAELWPLIMDQDWCLASPSNFSGGHHVQLWAHNKPYSYLGGQGAGGMGYGVGACGGAGLAAKSRGRIVINVQTDGDMNYTPGVLWTEAHHKLPVLTIMHNNRAWHQELMFLIYMAGVRGRGTDRASIGSTLRDPFISYAKMAEAYGVASEGPIEDPGQLQAALRRGVETVRHGEPYMIDVITQPR